ncbi:MAG: coproporphyrinogen III oxidase [Bacteroidota bacterium]
MDKKHVVKEFKAIQDEICSLLSRCDGGQEFKEDQWERPGGGGGRTRVLEGGDIIEK